MNTRKSTDRPSRWAECLAEFEKNLRTACLEADTLPEGERCTALEMIAHVATIVSGEVRKRAAEARRLRELHRERTRVEATERTERKVTRGGT